MSRTGLALAFALVAASPLGAQEAGGWKPTEKIERYAISGQSELDLYKSIGDKGPMVHGGKVRGHCLHGFQADLDAALRERRQRRLPDRREHAERHHHLPLPETRWKAYAFREGTLGHVRGGHRNA